MNNVRTALMSAGLCILMAAPAGLAAFTPPAGLELWLMADQGVSTTGMAVTGWADQSGLGGGRDMVNTLGTPTYVPGVVTGTSLVTGGPLANSVVRFSAGQIMSNAALHNAQTLVIVTKQTSGVVYTRHGGVNEYFGMVNGTGGPEEDLFLKNPQTYWVDAQPLVSAAFHVFSGLYQDPANGNTASIYMDQALVASNSPGGTSPTGLYDEIGARWGVTAYNAYFTGDIAELLVFSTDLSATDRLAVEAYLSDKYILEVPEPATLALFGLPLLGVLAGRRRR